jgi:hypothetical protein
VLSVWSKRCRGKEEGRSSSTWTGAALAGEDDEEDERMKSASPGPFLTSSANVDAVLLPSATTAPLDASQAFIFQEITAQQ